MAEDLAAVAARLRADAEILARAAESMQAKDAALAEARDFLCVDGVTLGPQTAALVAKIDAALGPGAAGT